MVVNKRRAIGRHWFFVYPAVNIFQPLDRTDGNTESARHHAGRNHRAFGGRTGVRVRRRVYHRRRDGTSCLRSRPGFARDQPHTRPDGCRW